MVPFETVTRDDVDAPAVKRARLGRCYCRGLAPRRFKVFVESTEAKSRPELDSLCVARLLRDCST